MNMMPIDFKTHTLENGQLSQRCLSDLKNVFADATTYEAALQQGDPLIYQVSSIESAQGDGQMHYGFGTLMPGRIGDEYYMTRGHYHQWRKAAEVYITLQGEGMMLLEHETTGETQLIPMTANSILYVPGFTAHRTMNTGAVPLMYIGVYPSAAGHDYAALAQDNFRHVVVNREGQPTLVERAVYQRENSVR